MQTNIPTQKSITKLQTQILQECVTMTSFALETGRTVAPSIMQAIEATLSDQQEPDIKLISSHQLLVAHNQLVRLIAPAKPTTLPEAPKYVETFWIFPRLRKPSLVNQLMCVALGFLLVFILTSLSPEVNEENIQLDFANLNGIPLLINELFVLSAAGLGASFAALFKVNSFITKYTFDSKHTTSYWIQLMLGIIAGLFISQLFDIDLTAGNVDFLSRPVLALLGGFSTTVVYRLLKQLLAALESLVKGDAEDLLETHRQLLQHDAQQVIQENRLKIIAELVTLKEKLAHSNDGDQFHKALDDVVAKFLEAG